MIFPFVRQSPPIVCVLFFLIGGSSPAIYAQLTDAQHRQNRNDREIRTTQSANTAALMMQEMQASLKSLPWNDFSPAVQTKIKTVVSGVPLFRRLPQQTVYADSEIYQFFLRHPDVLIGFWEHLGATQLSLREIREHQFILKETAGTAAVVEVLHRTHDLCIVYAKGDYRGPLIAKAYQGEMILVLRTQFVRDSMNEPMIVCNLDAFVQINSLGADVLAKLFFTSLAKIADSNFEVTVAFVSQVSKAAFRNSEALKGSAEEISSIRLEVCEEFCEVVDRAALRYARRNQPEPLASTPWQKQHAGLPEINGEDFLLSKFSTDLWDTDPFFASPKSFAAVSDNGADEFNVPKSIGTSRSEDSVPKLPKLAK